MLFCSTREREWFRLAAWGGRGSKRSSSLPAPQVANRMACMAVCYGALLLVVWLVLRLWRVLFRCAQAAPRGWMWMRTTSRQLVA